MSTWRPVPAASSPGPRRPRHAQHTGLLTNNCILSYLVPFNKNQHAHLIHTTYHYGEPIMLHLNRNSVLIEITSGVHWFTVGHVGLFEPEPVWLGVP